MGLMLERSHCLLVIIDVQEAFYTNLDQADADRFDLVTSRCAWLAGIARALEVPVLVTEEDPARNGPTRRAIVDRLPVGTQAHPKPVFGLADVPEILAAVEAAGRDTIVLAGAETDVCVAHSAMGLLDRGYRVVVVADATFSPGAMHEAGLDRIRHAGAELVHGKGLYYEWARTLEMALAFESDNPDLVNPPGFRI
ncbi:MAG: isochorismatase family protein [Chloroflexota bacterium]